MENQMIKTEPVATLPLQLSPETTIGGQELVLIGQDLDVEKMKSTLNNCLLTEEEISMGSQYWAHYEDKLPFWEIVEEVE